jgi:formylglycine-generating enzyme required for sulfatase activity
VLIGNACNAGEYSGGRTCGAVDYEYQIGKYEVTTAQYVKFLNAVGKTDTFNLYNSNMNIIRCGYPGNYQYEAEVEYSNRPINYVSWGDAARFANWLHNGEPTGIQNLLTTEDGAYYLNSAMSDAELMAVTRKSNWNWAIANEDEWYKAAYHKNDGITGNYWDYATGSNDLPSNILEYPDLGNNANYYDYTNGYTLGNPYYRTEVGTFRNSQSAYGTFDQTGNVREWTDGVWDSKRVIRDGCYNLTAYQLQASYRAKSEPTYESSAIGFRVAKAKIEYKIVDNGIPNARIIIEDNAQLQIENAAYILKDYITESTGATLTVIKTNNTLPPFEGVDIYVGNTIFSPVSLSTDLSEDGFIIDISGNTIKIIGKTAWGTEFGIYEFLERFVGVRWLIPGPDGTNVPVHSTLTVPECYIKDQPAAFSRSFGNLNEVNQTWARFNRIHSIAWFHHNLVNLFPPATYRNSHPEFYPIINGTRYLPPDGSYDWQPCFSEPGTVTEAISNIIDYFAANPDEKFYSLGINDSSKFCQCDDCLAVVNGRKNYINLPDYSDLYYNWCNQIIAGVLAVYPDKWFGCLAYNNVGGAPQSVTLHPRLITFVTYDRMKWIDPTVKAVGHSMSEDWFNAAENLGWYDYLYGRPYCLPRVYFHLAQDYLQYGDSHGVVAQTAELYPNWGEGPKPYIQAKLWWNPYADIDKLLNEWYTSFAGPAAADYIEEYFTIWEEFWTEVIPSTPWFIYNGDRQFLYYNNMLYLGYADGNIDLNYTENLLISAYNACSTDAQRNRVKILQDMFEYYKMSAEAYISGDDVYADSLSGVIDAVDSCIDVQIAVENRWNYVEQNFATNDLFENIWEYVLLYEDEVQGYDWGMGGLHSSYPNRTDPTVLDKLCSLRDNYFLVKDGVNIKIPKSVRHMSKVIAAAGEGITVFMNALNNTSFENVYTDGNGQEQFNSWALHYSEGTMEQTSEQHHTGSHSLKCQGVVEGYPLQAKPCDGPRFHYFAVAWIYYEPAPSTLVPGEVRLTISVRDGISEVQRCSSYAKLQSDVWRCVVTPVDLSNKAVEADTFHLMVSLLGFAPDDVVYIDDVELYKFDYKVTVDTVTIGNINNTESVTGYGSVNYEYKIAVHEVTTDDYVAFLNAVAATDTYGLYNTNMDASNGSRIIRSGDPGSYIYSVRSGTEGTPVNFVSWGDAVRYANWIHNGQPNGAQDATTTEDGAYTLNGATSDAALMAVGRNTGWKCAIPTADEWYKAAYHKNDGITGNYWNYATANDADPGKIIASPDPGNNANFGDALAGYPYRTDVGSFENSASAYGTFDQAGNVWEWTEEIGNGGTRKCWGGSYWSSVSQLPSTYSGSSNVPTQKSPAIGFRIVIPF